MAITDKLKSLYTKLGGDTNTSASNIEEWVNKIEEVAGSGSGGGSGSVTVEPVLADDGVNYYLPITTRELINLYNSDKLIFIETEYDNAEQPYMYASHAKSKGLLGMCQTYHKPDYELYVFAEAGVNNISYYSISLDDYPMTDVRREHQEYNPNKS